MIRSEVAWKFAKTAMGRGTYWGHPAMGHGSVTPGAPSPGEDRPPPKSDRAPTETDGYSIQDNAGVEPGLVPMIITQNDASSAKLKPRILRKRIPTERGEARPR